MSFLKRLLGQSENNGEPAKKRLSGDKFDILTRSKETTRATHEALDTTIDAFHEVALRIRKMKKSKKIVRAA